MFRIRRVPDALAPANAQAVAHVQDMLRRQFPGVAEDQVASLPEKLRDPLKRGLRSLLFISEDGQERVTGFALLLHAPDLRFTYLDYMASDPDVARGGVGGALYQRVREESLALGATALLFECLPDDPALSPDPAVRRTNARRLRFYERFGARPIIGTAYETPLRAGGSNPPYLVLDPLGAASLPGAKRMQEIVRAILERKYAGICSPDYVEKVVRSFRDDPVRLRPPSRGRAQPEPVATNGETRERIPLVVNDRHDIHHVRERGYVEAPVRIGAILRELQALDCFQRIEARNFPERYIRAVHDGGYVDFLKRACARVEARRSIYPYVFPVRNKARPPEDLPLRAGYYCIDTFTPLNGNAYAAARRAVDCALTAAEQVLAGHRYAYALVRPPGHHAERQAFGGFCYFNNAAVAANYLSRYGPVAVLDIDYHHGNGTQDAFFHRRDVLTISIHGHPRFAYPYFSGFRDETGVGAGAGFNLNLPLGETITAEQYAEALQTALRRIARFRPAFLVVAVGFDTAFGDPTGSWPHRAGDFTRLGEMIGNAGLPTLLVQEGGYRTRTLGRNARRFFEGLWHSRSASFEPPRGKSGAAVAGSAEAAVWREAPGEQDVIAVRELVASTGAFSGAEVAMAGSLVSERLAGGPDSGYDFLFVERGGRLAGYACYGRVPATEDRYDLYWIAVHPDLHGRGLGRQLLERAETAIAGRGGRRIYVDTSGREAYRAAREFYRSAGYRKVAELSDFYKPGDAKIIFMKRLLQEPET